MRPRLAVLAILAPLLLSFVPRAAAQDDDSEPTPLSIGTFNLQGSVTTGYRFDEFNGYRPQFRELFGLDQGFRVFDASVFGQAADNSNPFADEFSLQLADLGGDPFPTAQFDVSKKNLYDFRVNWRQSYFFWNQNDDAILPITTVAAGLSTGLTDNHDWKTVRKFGSVDFTLHATKNLRFSFDYYRPSDEGSLLTTRSLDFLGSPGYWGTFARANPYSLFAPLDDETNRFTGGVDYTYGSWNFHYAIGYQTFTENMNLSNVSVNEVSIDPAASSLHEPLANLSWSQFRRLTTPISEFSYLGKPLKRLEWRGGYIFYRYRGPADFTQAYNGIAPNSTGVQTPYSVSQSATAQVGEPNNIVTQGLTYHFFDWWSADLDYRYSRFVTNAVGDFESLFSGQTVTPVTTTATTDNVWRDGVSDFVLSMDFIPFQGLIIRPGIQFTQTNVEQTTGGVIVPATTLRINAVRPVISFGYERSKKFTLRGDFHSTTTGASYTAITPHTQQGFRFVARYHPTEKLSFEDEVTFLNSRLIAADFQNNVHSNAFTVNYALNDRFSIYAGFSYESYYAQGDIDYARGTTPLTDFLRDQELNRVWQGGAEIKTSKRSGLRLTGNFDRSTGVGAIFGVGPGTVPNEPPAYGPVTWPLVTGSGYYIFPVAGKLSVDLQRTYYDQPIVPVNNFGANVLTVKWTRDF
jgi:hypothetical protein